MNSLPSVYAYVKTSYHLNRGQTQATLEEIRFPGCLREHNATPATVKLFAAWVGEADKTVNGIIVVNRQRQLYSAATVDRAVKWLQAHHLLMLVERGGGRGNGNRYLVRWSFKHETLTARQKAINHPEHTKTLSSNMYARKRLLKLLEEKPQKHSFDRSKTSHDVSSLENQKRETFATANRQQRHLRNEKATRWAMAQLRAVSSDETALTAAAKAIRQALKAGRVWIGPEFNQLVRSLAEDLRDLESEEAWPENRRDMFSFTGYHAQQGLLWVLDRRRNEAEYQARQREREEAKRDPLPAGFSFRTFCKAAREKERQLATSQNAPRDAQGHLRPVSQKSDEPDTKHELAKAAGAATRPNPGEKSGYQRIQEERAKAADSLSQLLQEEGVGSISQLIRRQVATAGAVVHSNNRERRQSGEAYQPPGKRYETAKSAERPATVYAAEPVNLADMMSGYLEKLGGGEGVDEVEGIENRARG